MTLYRFLHLKRREPVIGVGSRKNHQRLPINGFDGLLKQEVIAFILPTIAAGITRIGIGEIGWEDWDSVPDLGEKILIVAFIYWVLWDFRRVMRTRRSVKKMAKMNLDRVKRRVERVLAGRDFLRNIEEFRIPRPWSSIEISDTIEGEEMALDKPSKITSLGATNFEQGSGSNRLWTWSCKYPAEGLAEQIETRMQAILDNHMQATRDSMFSNVMFSLFPLIVLKVLPEIV